MAVFRPFKAVRPIPEYASRVAALPYDVMNSDEAREMVKGNPYSFLHVDKAEVDLPVGTELYSEAVYNKAAENLQKLETDGICKQDKSDCMYIYRQIMDGRSQTGLVGCVSIDDYMNNVIKKHELTRADKEQDRINHVDYCDANTGPIFLTYRDNAAVGDIVKAWQARGKVVAMTGDGVNDAPALKVADIGCAMGKTGTDVAKGAADMILTDDNFATVVAAVEQGRGIYSNIRKAIHYLLSCNIGEILTIFLATVFSFPHAPLSPVQLLWLNLVTDSLPALALGMEPVEKTVMRQPPRGKQDPLFSRAFSLRLAWQGAMVGGLTLLAYGLGLRLTHDYAIANTMAFATLTLSQLFHAFDVRSEETSLFRLGFFSNPAMNKAFLAGVVLQGLVLLLPPLQGAFSVVPMPLPQWGIVLGLAVTPLVVCEIEKAVRRARTGRPVPVGKEAAVYR